MERNKFVTFLLVAGVCLSSCQQKAVTVLPQAKQNTVASELEKFFNLNLLPVYDSSKTYQVSSYDTTGGNDDGFNGKYSFLRRNADSSLVIFDVKGAGVINRIWTPTPTEDTLDFYFDGNNIPDLSIKYSDLFSGKQFPFVPPLCGNQIGGFFCYLPIPFEKGCKIVCRGKRLQFHQIQYRLYPESTPVKTFDVNLSDEDKKSIEKIQTLWRSKGIELRELLKADASVQWYEKSSTVELSPGESFTIFESTEGGRILGMEISPAKVVESLNKNIDIRMTWDDDKIPAVYCPVSDFFGYAFGSPSMQSLLLGSSADINYCYFPMPYDKKVKIELINRNDKDGTDVKLITTVYYNNTARDPQREGKFYSYWNKVAHSVKGEPHIFLNEEGRGHVVGTILQSQGLKAGMTYFFEGDDSTVVDGEMRIHGTGSEDYFNGGWYAMLDRWDGKVSLPIHGSLDYSLPFCRTGGYRLYLTDKISYNNSIYHSIEHGPTRNEFPVDYTSLTFYYGDAPPSKITEPKNELTSVFIPDTLMIYPQLMKFTTSGSVDFRSAWKYNTGGESFTFTAADNTWLKISLEDIPSGNYALYVDVIKKQDGCGFSLWQRQTQISPTFSTNNSSELRDDKLYVCDVNLQDLMKSITIRFSVQEDKNSFLLNRLILVRKNQ